MMRVPRRAGPLQAAVYLGPKGSLPHGVVVSKHRSRCRRQQQLLWATRLGMMMSAPSQATLRSKYLPPKIVLLCFASLLLTSSLYATAASAQTLVGGPMSADTTWGLASSPYILTNDLVIAAD